jgi:hypothetical protein
MPGLGLGLASGLPGNAHSRTAANKIACNAKIKYEPCSMMGRYTEHGDLTVPLWPVNPHIDHHNRHWICRMLRRQRCAQNAKSRHKRQIAHLDPDREILTTRAIHIACSPYTHVVVRHLASRVPFRIPNYMSVDLDPSAMSPLSWLDGLIASAERSNNVQHTQGNPDLFCSDLWWHQFLSPYCSMSLSPIQATSHTWIPIELRDRPAAVCTLRFPACTISFYGQ